MADLTYEIKIDFGSIGGKKKLTFTSWNGNAPRYDVRDWYDDKAGKGITFDKEELETLYGFLSNMFDGMKEEKADEAENPWDVEEEETQATLFDEVEEETESEYPEEIKTKFDILDKLFDGFKIEKAYRKMPFADGERLLYCVTKEKKKFPDYEKTVKALELNSFITGKGNLYIYTL